MGTEIPWPHPASPAHLIPAVCPTSPQNSPSSGKCPQPCPGHSPALPMWAQSRSICFPLQQPGQDPLAASCRVIILCTGARSAGNRESWGAAEGEGEGGPGGQGEWGRAGPREGREVSPPPPLPGLWGSWKKSQRHLARHSSSGEVPGTILGKLAHGEIPGPG